MKHSDTNWLRYLFSSYNLVEYMTSSQGKFGYFKNLNISGTKRDIWRQSTAFFFSSRLLVYVLKWLQLKRCDFRHSSDGDRLTSHALTHSFRNFGFSSSKKSSMLPNVIGKLVWLVVVVITRGQFVPVFKHCLKQVNVKFIHNNQFHRK